MCQEILIDHAVTIPMKLMWPINTVQDPLPSPARFPSLGAMAQARYRISSMGESPQISGLFDSRKSLKGRRPKERQWSSNRSWAGSLVRISARADPHIVV
jgi:hypothetical protein